MRNRLIVIPLLALSAPALAQAPAAPDVPQQLTDPATADRLADAMQAMSQALLDLPVGEIQAAVEGRKPTSAERKLTVGDLGRRDDPDFERNVRRQIAAAKPTIARSMKALNEALPAMLEGLAQAQETLERATANLPDPTYPKR
jgi:hypothetical protein